MLTSRLAMLVIALASGVPLLAQSSTFPFQLRVRQNDSFFVIPNGATLNLVAPALGRSVSVNVIATYQGNTSALVATAPQLLGSTAFSVRSSVEYPFALQPGSSISYDITFLPTAAAATIGQISIGFVEASASVGGAGAAGNILFNLSGSVPDFSLSYALQTNGNLVPVSSGGVVQFGATPINTASQATFVILNRGSGPGTVDSVSLTGDAFQLTSLTLLPATVAGNSSLQFGIRYLPTKIGSDTGSLEIKLGGQTVNLSIQGSSTGTAFTYEFIPETGDRFFAQPNQIIHLADAPVGTPVNYIVQVRNNGNAQGTVNAVSVSGTSFGLADLPFLPAILGTNELTSFTLTFAPTQSGRVNGRLRIGNDVFDLTGTGIGPRLTYSYTLGSSTTTIQSSGTVLFSPLAVGQTANATFTIRNDGTAAATITSLGISQGSIFRLDSLPSTLPVVLEPGTTLSFLVGFSPAVTGLATSQLLVDTNVFTLSGFGTAPPDLPGYVFSGATGTQEPFQQPAIGLALLDRYPLALQGTLTLTVQPQAFSADPAVQFSSGGRVVAFTIPANSTTAVFSNGANEVRLQTGTVASALTITPAFSTQTGLSLTPPSPAVLQLNVPQRASNLVNLQVASRSADAVTLQVTGYTTIRSLRSAEVQFTGKENVQLGESRFTINLGTVSSAWFQTPGSEAYGGQFSLLLPFTFRSASVDIVPLIDRLASATVTVTNEIGVSNPMTVSLQ